MSKDKLPNLDWKRIDLLIDMALEEDIQTGDATTLAIIDKNTVIEANIICKEPCVCAGLPIAERVFKKLAPNIRWNALIKEGGHLATGKILAELKGSAQAILTGERTALNFLQRLCGVATTTHKYVKALGTNTKTNILDTRKTTPGWRTLEKYATAVGGAINHRIGLYDRIMIKDNHRLAAKLEGFSGIKQSIEKLRKAYPNLEIEVEADTVNQVREAAEAGANYILLDNMSNDQMIKAIRTNSGRAKLEASGNITLEKIPVLAEIGLDFISIGALTHSVKAIDISLDIVKE